MVAERRRSSCAGTDALLSLGGLRVRDRGSLRTPAVLESAVLLLLHESSAERRGGHRLLICNTNRRGHAAQKKNESLLRDREEAFKFHMAAFARLPGSRRSLVLR